MYPTIYPTYSASTYASVPLEAERQGMWWYVPVTQVPTTSGYQRYHAYTAYAYAQTPSGNTELEAVTVAAQGGYSALNSLGLSQYPVISPHTSQQSPLQFTLGSPLSHSSPLNIHSSVSPVQSFPSLSSIPYPPTSQPILIQPTSDGSNVAHKPVPQVPTVVEHAAVGQHLYHSNPPVSRSKFVMWAGNIPSDATHDELQRFFNQPLNPEANLSSSTGSTGRTTSSGVSIPTNTRSNPNPPIVSLGASPRYSRGSSLSSQFPPGPGSSSSSSDAASGPPVLPSQAQTLSSSQSSQHSQSSLYGGVESIFLITRSHCAFVNFKTAEHLQAAIQHFNGVSLRPSDPRCAQLVCRVRNKEDDLKAGVGAQRGSGMHMKWIKQQKKQERKLAKSMTTQEGSSRDIDLAGGRQGSPIDRGSFSSSLEPFTSQSSLPCSHLFGSPLDDDFLLGKPTPRSSSSGSLSTNSSILQQYFPKRYFILKSLTQVRDLKYLILQEFTV